MRSMGKGVSLSAMPRQVESVAAGNVIARAFVARRWQIDHNRRRAITFVHPL